jgi:hypothetical protein
LHDLQECLPRPAFDLDTYKILTRFLAKPHGGSQVIQLAAG